MVCGLSSAERMIRKSYAVRQAPLPCATPASRCCKPIAGQASEWQVIVQNRKDIGKRWATSGDMNTEAASAGPGDAIGDGSRDAVYFGGPEGAYGVN